MRMGIAGRKIDAESQYYHTPQGGQHIVFETRTYVPDPIGGEIRRLARAVCAFLSQAIDVVVRAPHIWERELEAEPLGETIIQVERRLLRNGPSLLMMIQNHLAASLIHRWDNPIGSIQDSHRRVIVNRIDCEETRRWNLLLRSDDDETGHSAAGGLCVLSDGPREDTDCKTKNESEYELFPCHDCCWSFPFIRIVLAACPATHFVDRVRDGTRPCCEPVNNRDYREKDGGARLGEVWHALIEACAELGNMMRAIGQSSA